MVDSQKPGPPPLTINNQLKTINLSSPVMAPPSPVPSSPLPPPPAGQPAQARTIIQPVTKVTPPAAQAGTVFDQAPPATAAARQKAASFRSSAAAAIRQLLAVRVQAITLTEEAKADAALTEALAGEGVPPKRLAELLKLAGPLLEAFTTPPPAPQAGGQATPPAPQPPAPPSAP